MKALLDNRLAPVTFTWGFVESPFDQFSRSFIQWQDTLDEKFSLNSERRSFRAPLAESLLSLEPLTTPLDRYMLTETRSGWSAIFGNGLNVNDVFSPVSCLPTVLKCRGLEVACAPDRSKMTGATKQGCQIWGHVKFAIYGPNQTDWLNRVRCVYVMNDVSGWEFAAGGQVQPYEQTENYQKRRIADRFTAEMLDSYCAALGIDLFNPNFYGEECLLVHMKGKNSPGPSMSIAEARSRAYF